MSKKEIEKILEQNEDIITYKADKDFRCLTSSEKTLLENNKKIKKYIDQLEQENNKQNKIIDEMAKYMSENRKCDFIVSTNENCVNTDCKDCFKQYFEKKVDEE